MKDLYSKTFENTTSRLCCIKPLLCVRNMKLLQIFSEIMSMFCTNGLLVSYKITYLTNYLSGNCMSLRSIDIYFRDLISHRIFETPSIFMNLKW